MGVSFTGACLGGGRCADFGGVLHHGVSGGAPLPFVVVGNFPTDWEGVGRLSSSGDMTVDGVDATLGRVKDVDIPSPRVGDGVGKTVGY